MSDRPYVQSVSIIINTLNRARLLDNLLESLRHLDYKNFEVVVVNGPSLDDTEEVLSKWKDNIKIASCPEANLSMSRNIGIALSGGEVVAFIDDDAVPEPEWLDQAIRAFDNDAVAGAGGPVFDHTGYTFQNKYVSATRLGNAIWHLEYPTPHNCFPFAFEFPYLSGGNVLFRRRTLIHVGGFDEEYQYYLDETDVCLRLIDAGYVLRQLPNSFIHHKYAPSHIREHRIPKYRYPILKSKIYFSNRHGLEYCTQEEIDEDNNNFIANNRAEIIRGISEKLLDDQDLLDFEQHAIDALDRGKQAARMPQKLISKKLLEKYASPFKKFENIQCEGRQLTVVLLSENYDNTQVDHNNFVSRQVALDLAELGHKVHLITSGSEYITVDFEDGIWVHRVSYCDFVKTEQASDLGVPQDVWNRAKTYHEEIERISAYRTIDLVCAPMNDMSGLAVLLDDKHPLITGVDVSDLDVLVSDIYNGKSEGEGLERTLKNLKLRIIGNTEGIVADSDESVEKIRTVSNTVNDPNTLIFHPRDISGLIQYYRRFLSGITQKNAAHIQTRSRLRAAHT